MNRRPPGTLRVLRLLAWTALIRLLRAARIARSKRAATARADKPGRRGATARRRTDPLTVLMLVMLPFFAMQAMLLSNQAVGRIAAAAQNVGEHGRLPVRASLLPHLARLAPDTSEQRLREQLAKWYVDEDDTPSQSEIVQQFLRRGPVGFTARQQLTFLTMDPVQWSGPEAAATFANAGAVIALAIALMMLASAFGAANTNLAGGEWTFAWLMTFPVRTGSLVLAKALEYSLVQFLPWLMLFPLLLQMLWALDQPGAVWLAAGGTLATAVLTGSLRLWIETWLRLRLSLKALRTVQGLGSLLALMGMVAVFGVCLAPRIPAWFTGLAQAMPELIRALPGAWPMAWSRDGWTVALPGATLCAAAFGLACRGSVRLLAGGTMRSGGVDAGARGAAGTWAGGLLRPGILGKDLALLLRDRNFLVQTLIVPVAVIALQLVMNPGLGDVQGRGAALVAYGIGLYSVIGGCFQVLSAEGRALWMLYTLPIPIRLLLRQKARLWASIAVGFALIALLVFVVRAPGELQPSQLLADMTLVAVGTWCAAHIAAGISILGTDPAADHVPRQPKVRHIYLYFFFASTFLLSLQSPDPAVRLAGLMVFATLAYSIWQRACDRLPWLLDPIGEDRREIGVYDGGAALVVFFILQALVLLIAVRGGVAPNSLLPMFIAFAVAGAVTLLLFWLLLSLRGVDLAGALGLRRPAGRSATGALLGGAALGLLTAGLGLAYLFLVRTTGWFELPDQVPAADERTALILLAVVAAPVVEEVLFRGLVFGGLRRALPLPVALLWSSGLFMAVHPVHSWLPVFCVGVAAAWVYHRTRFLPAAMLLHAVYNLVVVGWGR